MIISSSVGVSNTTIQNVVGVVVKRAGVRPIGGFGSCDVWNQYS